MPAAARHRLRAGQGTSADRFQGKMARSQRGMVTSCYQDQDQGMAGRRAGCDGLGWLPPRRYAPGLRGHRRAACRCANAIAAPSRFVETSCAAGIAVRGRRAGKPRSFCKIVRAWRWTATTTACPASSCGAGKGAGHGVGLVAHCRRSPESPGCPEPAVRQLRS